jgi:hypothetical protein
MNAKLGSPQKMLGGFLAAYFVLLLFCFSVSMSQGAIWLFAGLISLVCCCVVFFGLFTRYNYRYHRECLRDESLDNEALSGRRSQRRLIKVRFFYSCLLPSGGDFVEKSLTRISC